MAGTIATSWCAWPLLCTGGNLVWQAPIHNLSQAIIRWGGALLELAHFQQGSQANVMIDEAAAKFKEALKINPRKHDALWCLGNAYTSQVAAALCICLRVQPVVLALRHSTCMQGFLSNDESTANSFFKEARTCFQKALAEVSCLPDSPAATIGARASLHAPAGTKQRSVPESARNDRQGERPSCSDCQQSFRDSALMSSLCSQAPAMYQELQRQLAGGPVSPELRVLQAGQL